jgi:hypothetical protein
MLAKELKGTQGAVRLRANAAIEPAGNACRHAFWNICDWIPTTRGKELFSLIGKGGHRALKGWENPAEREHPELGVRHDERGFRSGQQCLEGRDTEPEGSFRRFSRRAVGEQQLGDHRTRR